MPPAPELSGPDRASLAAPSPGTGAPAGVAGQARHFGRVWALDGAVPGAVRPQRPGAG